MPRLLSALPIVSLITLLALLLAIRPTAPLVPFSPIMPKKLAKTSTTAAGASHAFKSSISTTNSASTDSSAAMHPVLTDDQPLPRLFVFDLDYTLWPFWVDTHVSPPLKALSGGAHTSAVDKFGESFAFYGDVPRILHSLPQAGLKMAVASRTHAPDIARDMLKLLHVPPASHWEAGGAAGGAGSSSKKEKSRRALDFFDAGLEMYPTSKVRHMDQLQKRTGVAFQDMLFFDDESRNRDVEQLGVTMWLVRDGLTWDELERGVLEWRKRRGYLRS